MEKLKENNLLFIHPNTVNKRRQNYGLDGPGVMQEAVDILRDWIKKQSHFKKKDFPQCYLETTILSCKGSLERSKLLLDRMCTLRTLMPEYFGVYNVKTDFGDLTDHMSVFVLRKPTREDYRVYLAKIYSDKPLKNYLLDYLKYSIILADYMKVNDYLDRIIVIYDLLEANLTDFITNVNLLDLKHHAAVILEGFGARPQRIHLLTKSKSVNTLLSLVKTFVKPKIAERIYVNKSYEELYEVIPRDILPRDYGGGDKTIRELQDIWNMALSSEKNIEYLKEINQSGTDESLRSRSLFNEQYAGMAGTFRFLRVD